jgi:putative isomerase
MAGKYFKVALLFAFIFLAETTFAQPIQRDIRTTEYRQLQEKLCQGWNTWYNNSVITHVLLPESFSINLCLATSDNRNFLKEVNKASEIANRPEKVLLGLRSDDGSYISLKLEYQGIDLSVQSATDGDDELILVAPEKPSVHYLIIEAGVLWDKEGIIGKSGNKLVGQFSRKEITVNVTAEPITNAYTATTAPHLTVVLNGEIGIYTGKPRTLAEIKSVITNRRDEQQKHADSYGTFSESFIPMQTILAWNTIYDAANKRAITPVSRLWNINWGGWVLFDWDTYFASYMLSLFNKDLAYANAIEITKAITPDGFIPNFQSVSSYVADGNTSSWDRSQPPVGSTVILNVYKKYQEKWFLTEVYNELLTWNRWWVKNRAIKGYLAWGSFYKKDNKGISEELQGAMYESGLDNSPMYDSIPFNNVTHTMELADVGLMSMYIMDCNSLMQISQILGKKEDASELKKRSDFYTKQLATLWDEKTGMFLNKRTDTDVFSYRISPTNFYPMLAKACTQKQAERMIREHYYNLDEFYGEYIMPSISRNDPAFGDNSYWRGRVWAPLNFLVYLGMRNYDLKGARIDLINKSKNLLMKNWKENSGIFENYNAVTGQGNDVHNADGFYHWGALLTFMEFIENGLAP